MTKWLTTETIAAIAAWREQYEADGLVTHSTIAKAVGVSVPPAAAPVSIWQLAAGKAIATVRQGGRHVEVSA